MALYMFPLTSNISGVRPKSRSMDIFFSIHLEHGIKKKERKDIIVGKDNSSTENRTWKPIF